MSIVMLETCELTHRDLVWQFRFLITGGIVLEKEPEKPHADWLTEKMWGEFYRISKVINFFPL